jgi:hypothetical protein
MTEMIYKKSKKEAFRLCEQGLSRQSNKNIGQRWTTESGVEKERSTAAKALNWSIDTCSDTFPGQVQSKNKENQSCHFFQQFCANEIHSRPKPSVAWGYSIAPLDSGQQLSSLEDNCNLLM